MFPLRIFLSDAFSAALEDLFRQIKGKRLPWCEDVFLLVWNKKKKKNPTHKMNHYMPRHQIWTIVQCACIERGSTCLFSVSLRLSCLSRSLLFCLAICQLSVFLSSCTACIAVTLSPLILSLSKLIFFMHLLFPSCAGTTLKPRRVGGFTCSRSLNETLCLLY